MQRALLACFGALFIGLTICSPASAQEDLWGETRPVARQVGPAGESESTDVIGEVDACALSPFRQTIGLGDRRRLIVATTYCSILRRPPDEEGLTYWTGLLADGLGPYELVQTLVASPEHQARGAKSFSETLSALTLGPRKRAELEQRRLVAAAAAEEQQVLDEAALAEQTQQAQLEREAEGIRLADETRRADEERLAEEARQDAEKQRAEAEKRQARLRIRDEISSVDFDNRVGAAGLGELQTVTDALVYGRLNQDGQRVTVAYVHLSKTRGMRVSPGSRGRSTVGTWASEIGAHVAINGNWYSPYDGPAVSGGEVYGGNDHFYTALFGFTAEGDAIIEHHRETNDSVDDRVVEAVAGHPTLIFRGERTTDFGGDPTFTRRNPRTAIGLDGSGDVLILVTVDGRSSSAKGMTGDETAKLMERLGAFDAVMLDGGGSSTMWITGQGVVNRPSGALRAVGNQIAVYGD